MLPYVLHAFDKILWCIVWWNEFRCSICEAAHRGALWAQVEREASSCPCCRESFPPTVPPVRSILYCPVRQLCVWGTVPLIQLLKQPCQLEKPEPRNITLTNSGPVSSPCQLGTWLYGRQCRLVSLSAGQSTALFLTEIIHSLEFFYFFYGYPCTHSG